MIHCPITAIAAAFARPDASSESTWKSWRRSTAVVNATTQMAPSPAARRARRVASPPLIVTVPTRVACPAHRPRSPCRSNALHRRTPRPSTRQCISNTHASWPSTRAPWNRTTERGRLFTRSSLARTFRLAAAIRRCNDTQRARARRDVATPLDGVNVRRVRRAQRWLRDTPSIDAQRDVALPHCHRHERG